MDRSFQANQEIFPPWKTVGRTCDNEPQLMIVITDVCPDVTRIAGYPTIHEILTGFTTDRFTPVNSGETDFSSTEPKQTFVIVT